MTPEDWISYQLGNLVTFKNGLNFNQGDRGEAIKIVGVADFKSRTKLTDTASLATVTVANKVRESELLKDGDLLLVRSNGNKALIGRCLYFPKVLERLAFSGFTIRGRVDRDKLFPDFASHLMRSKNVTNQLHENGEGTNINNLSQEVLNNVLVKIPGIDEQRHIAKILNTWDEAIEIAEKLLINSRRQKKALAQTLLRLTNTGTTAENWQIVRLKKIAERIQRTNEGKENPILMISSGTGFVRQDEKYSRFMAGKSLDNYLLLKQGEFAYNKGNSKRYEFGCVFQLEKIDQGLVPHVYICFALNADCDGTFFKYLFEADYLHDQLGALVNTGVRNNGLLNIRPNDFLNVNVPLPPISEQRSIASILEAATTEIERRQEDLMALKTQKQALMQAILTGKRRLPRPRTKEAVSA